MMYFSKEELERIIELLDLLYDDADEELYTKVKHQLEEME